MLLLGHMCLIVEKQVSRVFKIFKVSTSHAMHTHTLTPDLIWPLIFAKGGGPEWDRGSCHRITVALKLER
ncbi:hypothetical protein CH63R_05192 [Colletotrichum higginsianum IMI 349063]|uniref:Uncharacterized protein n=1 Tax=Colletotrichum higginsianum (strain IMI 349063) TaxID=759273 RepID=A0A1B7YLI5_COLHI|nr:hypothetical protein CH63R_05192 [Colletotrichum higginsianum IMI 349063]OBR12896.1 hypothetical protein CH63R_05192 [Colletotrichum higginsianum IMI 349063]